MRNSCFAVFFFKNWRVSRRTRAAWIAACAIQAALFGWLHAYQNAFGIAITGTIGLIMGVLFLVCGRNLWPLIIGHGLYDASRTILFYFQGTSSP
jgi:uncharacterized protein